MLEPPEGVSMDTVTQAEKQGLARAQAFSTTGDSYAAEHGTRPATIGLVLSASPVALLAWIGEKFLTWTDKDPSLETILDSVTLYWFTQSFPRAIYPYRQYMVAPVKYFHPDADYYCKKPMGYSYFPMELAPMPKSWVETTGKLVWYREHMSGGHFAAMEEPESMLQDVEDFVKQVWTKK